jgi:hypothetical protein
MHSCPLSCYIVSLRSKYFPRYSVLKHCHSLFIPQYESPSFTPTQTKGKIVFLFLMLAFSDSRHNGYKSSVMSALSSEKPVLRVWRWLCSGSSRRVHGLPAFTPSTQSSFKGHGRKDETRLYPLVARRASHTRYGS